MRIDVTIEAESGSYKKAKLKDGAVVGYRETLAPYPYPYGFIPGTIGEDGDELDCFVLTDLAYSVGETVRCETIAAFQFMEDDETEYKALAVPYGADNPDVPSAYATLCDFLRTIFKKYPEVRVSFGSILPKEAIDKIIVEHSA